MESTIVNGTGERDLLFVMGWGNRLQGENERWFIDRLAGAGYTVHAIELPTDIADFDREYRRPLQRYHDTHEPSVVLGHSSGGLVGAHLRTEASRVYLSPWWGLYGLKYLRWQSVIVPRLPIRAKIVSINTTREEIGALATDAAWAALPKRVSPVFITEIDRAQASRPPIGEDAVVFCSLRDTIVSLRAIGEAVPREQVRLYDGGHEPFSSISREATTEEVLTVLANA
jgi:alpha-beta hydrolase superfamily lysophospholipase